MTETEQIICSHRHLAPKDGYIVCVDCGDCIDRNYTIQPERNYDTEEINKRCHYRIMPTVPIGARTIFYSDKTTKSRYWKLARINQSAQTTAESALLKLSGFIQKVIAKILPDSSLYNHIFEETQSLLCNIYKKEVMKHKKREIVALVCLLIVCRQSAIPITVDDIIKVATTFSGNTYELNRRIVNNYIGDVVCFVGGIKRMNLQKYIERALPLIGNIPMPIQVKIYEAIPKIKKLLPSTSGRIIGDASSSKTLKGIASGLVYAICKANKICCTQHNISKVFHTNEVTIRKRTREIEIILNKGDFNG